MYNNPTLLLPLKLAISKLILRFGRLGSYIGIGLLSDGQLKIADPSHLPILFSLSFYLVHS